MKMFCLAVLLVACSGSGNSNDDSCFESSLQANGQTQACFSCVQTSCRSQLDTVESACADYLTCVCPDGVFMGSNESECQPATGSDCLAALSAGSTCENTMCPSQCGTNN